MRWKPAGSDSPRSNQFTSITVWRWNGDNPPSLLLPVHLPIHLPVFSILSMASNSCQLAVGLCSLIQEWFYWDSVGFHSVIDYCATVCLMTSLVLHSVFCLIPLWANIVRTNLGNTVSFIQWNVHAHRATISEGNYVKGNTLKLNKEIDKESFKEFGNLSKIFISESYLLTGKVNGNKYLKNIACLSERNVRNTEIENSSVIIYCGETA